MAKKNKQIGLSLNDLLKETGELVEISAVAIKRVVTWQISQKMEAEKISQKKNGCYDVNKPFITGLLT